VNVDQSQKQQTLLVVSFVMGVHFCVVWVRIGRVLAEGGEKYLTENAIGCTKIPFSVKCPSPPFCDSSARRWHPALCLCNKMVYKPV